MNLLFDLIQVAIGEKERLSCVPSPKEWLLLYNLSQKHTLMGVCLFALDRLPSNYLPPKPLLLKWLGKGEMIKKQNELISLKTKELSRLFQKNGLRTCVLKGQGMAALYNNDKKEGAHDLNLKLLRQSGDIDIWVDGNRDEIIRYVRERYKCGRAVIHHIDVEVFNDVLVEVHFVPSYAYNPFRYNQYRRFFEENGEECFTNSGSDFNTPSIRFNAIYELMHIYRHVFHEGIGLRQLMDYYFVLQRLKLEDYSFVTYWLKKLKLERFAASVLFVEQHVFKLKEEKMFCEPDEASGAFLLNRIMQDGNFGHNNIQNIEAHDNGSWALYKHNIKRLFEMLKYYPSEVLWAPVWKVGHFCWRKMKGY